MPFAQVVVGSPGSGKSTYCLGMSDFLKQMKRKVAIVNFDPANDALPYECGVDISEIISVADVMEEMNLGPNGAILFCMDFLNDHFDLVEARLSKFEEEGYYILFDFPGQVELYTHNQAVRSIITRLEKKNYRMTCVNLVDSYYCTDATKYISLLLLCLNTTLQLALPQVHVLSKIDLIERFSKLDFHLDFYTEVQNLSYLEPVLNQSRMGYSEKYRKLNKELCETISDFNLIAFETLCITDADSISKLLSVIDKSNGYVFGAEEIDNRGIFDVASSDSVYYDAISAADEKYLHEHVVDD